ncbi:glycosyltransferase family 39 protein [Hyalangium gracile]|uniref:glycosyltransferase family 39 protein n=1 Tax=Hyalangium gracile TaxID=394092 RepID=UPI001CCB5FF8|nr:glycosyltransferase family 39 protein [Hyalangium gracile]
MAAPPADTTSQPEKEPESFVEGILGKKLHEEKWIQRWGTLPLTLRTLLLGGGFAALLLLPYIGAVGLWDPWETHYGEVARMMVMRQDYLYPFYENAWFFSKPPLTMWMQALGMQVVGALRGTGELARYTEWGMRMPFGLLSVTAVALLTLAVSRVVSRRAGLATAFVLTTMPLYFLLTRQAVTDTPFVTTMICAMACAFIAQLDETTKRRTAWWYAFYVFLGLSVLAKGLLGLMPAALLVVYAALAVIPWSWDAGREHILWLLKRSARKEVREGKKPMPVLWGQMFRMRLGTGILVFAAVAVPWYLALSLFDGVDDEGKNFFYRFFIHDHLNRLTAGVHTTTPGGSFTYFIEQGGYAIFPWVALLPGAFAVVSRLRLRSASKADHLALLAVVWVAFSFFLMASSATKFHHYVFPVLPGLAILIALFIDRLWHEGPAEHAVSLLFGLVLFALVGKDMAENPKEFTDLFVYNYDRPYPADLVNKPIAFFTSRSLWMGDLATMVLLALGVYTSMDAFFSKDPKEHTPAARTVALLLLLCGGVALISVANEGKVSSLGLLGIALIVVGAFSGWVALRSKKEERLWNAGLAAAWVIAGGLLAWRGFSTSVGSDALLRALMEPVNVKKAMGIGFAVGGTLTVVGALRRSRVMLFGTFWMFTFSFALWFNWNHWVDLSHHWTQRDLFWRYWRQAKPGEPIAAFMMNWHGETFYSRNTVEQFRSGDSNQRMRNFAAQPGREWALVEHNRLGILTNAIGSDKKVTVIDRGINNKFVLVAID